MPQNTFKFKQFTIQQDSTPMKVGTDGVLIGAWCSVPHSGEILDIGCGTGLIALMLAQRSTGALVTAVEINEEAYLQASENIENSNWKKRITVYHSTFQDFALSSKKRFDMIACNPPYFQNAYKQGDSGRVQARHTDSLPFRELFYFSALLLRDGGAMNLIVPSDISEEIEQEAKRQGLLLSRFCRVYPKPGLEEKRRMMEFLKCSGPHFHKEEVLTIENTLRHHFTEEYKALTKDFYLKF